MCSFSGGEFASLVDKNSEQPTPESARECELCGITSGGEEAVLHCLSGSFAIPAPQTS